MSKGIAVKTALSLAMHPHDMTAAAIITSLKRNVKSSNEYISCISYIHRSIDRYCYHVLKLSMHPPSAAAASALISQG